MKCGGSGAEWTTFRAAAEKSDHRERLLLRPSTVGPRRRATDEGDELAPSHLLPSGQGSQPTTSLAAMLCAAANFGHLWQRRVTNCRATSLDARQ